jgi:NAD(P)-dependent dehydrogenase (short-subunit alcohol dehydrogenase family)
MGVTNNVLDKRGRNIMCDPQTPLAGNVAVVTGGSRGYGYGIAQVLRANGAEVLITGRDEAALQKAAEELGVEAMAADVTVPGDWDRVFETVLGRHGELDILVNNAGAGIKIAPFEEQTDETIEAIVRLNLTGQMFGWRRAAKVMREQKDGLIINISSGCAIHAWPGWGPYSAAKAGLNQASHCLYTELREAGVRVCTVTPYWGDTNFRDASDVPQADDDTRRKMMQSHEMGQLVLDICRLPPHLVIPDVTVQPLVQQIQPM